MSFLYKQLSTIALASTLILVGCDQSPDSSDTTGNSSDSSLSSQQSAKQTNPMLELVSEDTLFFMGTKKPFPVKEFIAWNDAHVDIYAPTFPPGFAEEMVTSDVEDAIKILSFVFEDFENRDISGDQLRSQYGMGETVQIAAYSVGVLPVVRWSLADTAAFDKYIDSVEKRAKVVSTPINDGTENIRLYKLAKGKKFELYLVLGRVGNDAVLTVDLVGNGTRYLDNVLGKVKPVSTLAQSKRLDKILAEYDLYEGMVGFIDHEGLIEAIISTNTQAGQMIASLETSASKRDQKKINVIKSPGCRVDIRRMAKAWPKTVMGFTDFNMTPQAQNPVVMKTLTVVEIKDQSLLTGMQSLSGFIPPYVQTLGENGLMALGVGLNVNLLTPFINQQWNQIVGTKYECEPLKEIQEELAKQNPGALGVVAAFASGAHGASATLNHIEIDTEHKSALPGPKNIDGIVTITADNPRLIFNMLAGVIPQFKGVTLPSDDSPMAVDLMAGADGMLKGKIAVKGNHLVLYSGENGEQQALMMGSLPIKPNGTLAMSVDYKKAGTLLSSVVPDVEGMEDGRDFVDYLKAADLKETLTVEFTSRGIEIKSKAKGTL
ncbi:MAG: hypothetical protein GY696_13340 [Gammaproteobacteria bacterium]|nr:hypothetical protein [Gammaproteobacteria bacterium]